MIDDSFNDTVSIKQNLEGLKKDTEQNTSKSNTNNNSQQLINLASNQTNMKEVQSNRGITLPLNTNNNSNPKKNVTIAEQTNLVSNSKTENKNEIEKSNDKSESIMNLNR